MSDSKMSNRLDDSAVLELTGKIMVVAIIVLFVVVVFVFSLHLYAKWFWYRRGQDAATRRRRHQESSAVTVFRQGLDPSVLKSIPVVKFAAEDFKDGGGLECAVCLSEVSEGEKARLLPKCNHGFHVECIDMWFQSHSTCPICRNPVSDQSSPNSSTSGDSDPSSLESRIEIPAPPEEVSVSTGFPTNVLFWGNETQVSTMGVGGDNQIQGGPPPELPSSPSSSSSSTSNNTRDGGGMVIDIPRQMNEEGDSKSPMMPTRMRSFKRLLSRDRRVNPSSPSNVDVEQMTRGQS